MNVKFILDKIIDEVRLDRLLCCCPVELLHYQEINIFDFNVALFNWLIGTDSATKR